MNHWLPAPDPIPSLGGNVHVWALPLEEFAFDAALWHGRLSPEEQDRAAKFKFARDQRRYVIAHAALRDILSGYANADAANLRFNDGPNGKPQLAPPFAASGIAFNLSHSHETALIAVNQGNEIGVDIEFAKADFEFFDVASHFFTKSEVAALRALPPALQRQAFYKCWTSKEAFLKAKGTGLSGALDEVQIKLVGDHVQIQASVAGWSLTELNPCDGYEAALVIHSKPVEVFCYRGKAA
jgi:4'-phosphopantetheinyl transferase